MEVNGVLPISAQPVQEGQEVTRPNREGGDAVAFGALLYLILGMPQAGISSTDSERVKAGETAASASGAVPIWKGSGALAIANGEPNDPRAFLTNDIFAPPAEVAGATDGVAPTPMLKELGASGAKFDGVFTDGSTPKSAAVADEIDASIGGGRVEPGAVSEINRDPIEALTAQANAHGKEIAAVNETARVVRDPAESAPIGVTADEVETDPQVEPEQSYEQPALTASTVGRDSAVNIEPFDQAQGRPETGKVEPPTVAGATGPVVASGHLSNHVEPDLRTGEQFKLDITGGATGIFSTYVEPELATEPTAKNHPDLRTGGQFKLDITAGAAARLPGRGQGSDSQVHPAQDSEKPTTGTSNPSRLIHGPGKNSARAEVESVTGTAGEIRADAELTGKFQFGKTADGGVAEQDARLLAEADPKTDAPRAGRGPAQRLSDIAAPVPRPDIAAEKLGPAGDPTPASWRSTVNRVADELASHVKLNKHEAVIQLDPPELGKIKIEMRLDGEKLAARIVAEVHESRQLIESHLQELRQALRLHHLDLADVRVSQDGWSGGSGDPMQGFRQQQPDGEPQWARNSENSAAAASASPERIGGGDSAGEKGRVSVWV